MLYEAINIKPIFSAVTVLVQIHHIHRKMVKNTDSRFPVDLNICPSTRFSKIFWCPLKRLFICTEKKNRIFLLLFRLIALSTDTLESLRKIYTLLWLVVTGMMIVHTFIFWWTLHIMPWECGKNSIWISTACSIPTWVIYRRITWKNNVAWAVKWKSGVTSA